VRYAIDPSAFEGGQYASKFSVEHISKVEGYRAYDNKVPSINLANVRERMSCLKRQFAERCTEYGRDSIARYIVRTLLIYILAM